MSTNVITQQRPSSRTDRKRAPLWGHLREPHLAAAALQLLNGEAPALKASAEAHLHRCERCAARLEELREVLAGERHAAVDAADAEFSDARLAAQRRGILGRLERRQRGARVLPFPSIAEEPASRRDRPAMRWLAAAAAAGLFVGLAAGPIVFPDVKRFPRTSVGAVRQAPAAEKWWLPSSVGGATASKPGITLETDELFLSDMETALNKRRIPALSALDDLTPRTHELVNKRPDPRR